MKTLTLALLLSSLPGESHPVPEASRRPDIVDTAIEAGSFSILTEALTRAGLVDTLRGDGPFTVFAPTDEAFGALPPGTLQSLLEPSNRETLTRILTYHVVATRATAEDAIAAGRVATVAGDEVRFSIREGRLRVDEATVLQNDLEATNGIIHVIDSVLLPPGVLEPEGRKVIGVYTERPGNALAAQLGLDRERSLLITRLVEGGNAEKAGLQRWDVVTAIDGEPASDEQLKAAKEARGYRGQIELDVVRRGRTLHLRVEVGIARH